MVYRRWFVYLVVISATTAYGMGRKAGDGRDIEPVRRGSAANPNPAFSAPDWSYDNDRSRPAPESRTSKHTDKKTTPKLAAPEEPVAPADNFPDYTVTTPQPTPSDKPAAVKPAPPLAKDSLEPPLPEEPGGDPDKRPSK